MSPPQDLTTEVYCIPSRGKISDVAATTTLSGANTDTASITAVCPPGTRLLSGGFSGHGSTSPFTLSLTYESAPAGNGWSIRAANSGNNSGTPLTAHAYCYAPPKAKKKGKKASIAKKKRKKVLGPRPLTVLLASGSLGTAILSTSSVAVPPCAGRLRAVSGGFSTAPTTPTAAANFSESRLVSGAWRITAIQGGSPGASIRSQPSATAPERLG